MPKLYFRWGAMSSGKSTQLLVALFQYLSSDKKALLIKPAIDIRDGQSIVKSRVPGLTREANIIMPPKKLFTTEELIKLHDYDVIFIDEAQFFHPSQIEQFSYLSLHVPVIAYGLRTDFRGKLFPASAMLFALADEITEIKNICKYCTKKATQNLKLKCDESKSPSNQIELGAEDKYVGVCKSCYYKYRWDEDAHMQHWLIHTLEDVKI